MKIEDKINIIVNAILEQQASGQLCPDTISALVELKDEN